MNINALPVEILDCIISHIPTPQPHLAALCLVQRDWYHFFSRRLYRKPTFAKPEHLLLFLHRLTPRHVPLLLELDLAPHPGLVDDALLLQLVGLLSSSASTPQLTHIDLTGCTSITAHGFVPLLTSLGGTLTSARLGRCSRITNLSLTLLAVHSPNLHTLGLANTTLFDPHALSPLALYARHTHTLDLSHCPWVTNATLLSDLRPLSGLRSVRLSGCAGVSAEGVRGMASAHPWLEEVEVDAILGMSDAQLAWIVGCLRRPRRLGFRGTRAGTVTVQAVAETGRVLEELDLRECWGVERTGAETLLKGKVVRLLL